MICPHCQAEIPDDMKFCAACGKPTEYIDAAVAQPAPEPAPVSVPLSDPEPPRKEHFWSRTPAAEAEPAAVPEATQPAPPAPAPVPETPHPRNDALNFPQSGSGKPIEEANYAPVNSREPLSVFSFVGIIILMMIPILNIIMIIRWSFSKSVNINKRRFGIASIIVFALALILAVALGILFPGLYRPVFDMLASLFLIG